MEQNTEVFSTKQTLRLVEANVASYGGVNPNMNMVLAFPEDGEHIVQLSGDQGAGKTSMLNAVLSCLGGAEPANAINSQTGNKKAQLTFEKDGITYVVSNTKSSFTVTMQTAAGSRSKLESPKTELQKIVGNVALNPMHLKEMKGKEQLAWLRKVMPLNKEQTDLETKIATGRKAVYDERTSVNGQISLIEKTIAQTGYFAYDAENKCYNATDVFSADYAKVNGATTDENELKAKFDAAEKVKINFGKAQDAIAGYIQQTNTLANEVCTIDAEIDRLTALKIGKQSEMQILGKRLEQGQQYLLDNATAEADFEAIRKEYMNFNEIARLKTALEDAGAKYESLEKLQDRKIQLEASLDQYDVVKKQFIASTMPAIPDFEVVANADGIDTDTREEGLYYQGKTMAMLSESEMFEWYIQMLKTLGVKICVIENITSLGSKAIKAINDYANKHHCYVFCSAMDRNQESIKVEFLSEIK